jgi:hypothetical protein
MPRRRVADTPKTAADPQPVKTTATRAPRPEGGLTLEETARRILKYVHDRVADQLITDLKTAIFSPRALANEMSRLKRQDTTFDPGKGR